MGYPRPLPALVAYWNYLSFGDRELPDKTLPGSHRVWHSFRIVHSIYGLWDLQRQDPDKAKDTIRKGRAQGKWDYFHVPQPRPKKKSKSGKSGRDVP